MKPIHTMLTMAAVLLAACSQPNQYYTPTPGVPMGTQPGVAKQRQYLALPGQPTVQVGTEEADDAFDRQVQAYTQETVAQDPKDGFGGVPTVQQPYTPVVQQPVQQPANPFDVPVPSEYDMTPAVPTTPAAQPTTVEGTADYAVQITNGTTGRLFVEAQDAAGHIFPCGPMFAGQSINTPPDPVGPLTGPITVVIRDPDKDGAPEIRRYKVDPPAQYRGKTIGITILPGGQYRADVDNQVYYTSPAPQKQESDSAE